MTASVQAFAEVQPLYAAHGIATFPVREDKRPAIRGYHRVGLHGSGELARKFGSSSTFGFMTNARSGVTVLDVDVADERVLADAQGRHGTTPLIALTATKKLHAYYRHAGERRCIRPWGGLSIDLLGAGGLVVAPPSVINKGAYQFIEGRLDDLDRLPVMRGLSADMYARTAQPVPDVIVPDDFLPAEGSRNDVDVSAVPEGRRNRALWDFCMRRAGTCEYLDTLVGAARARNSECCPPLPDREVVKTAESAWEYEQRGENWFGRGRQVVSTHDEVDGLMMQAPDAFLLLNLLRRHHNGKDEFIIANKMADNMPCGGWRRQRLAAARSALEAYGKIKLIRKASTWHGAAVYKWN